MKREIKFRAWVPRFTEMVEPCYVEIFSDGSYLVGRTGECSNTIPDKNDDIVLMQFTGLHDKNGVEIYEGDILKRSYEARPYFLLEVGFNAHLGFVGTTHPGQNHTKALSYMMKHEGAEYTEVIGNIYQNPELLQP